MRDDLRLRSSLHLRRSSLRLLKPSNPFRGRGCFAASATKHEMLHVRAQLHVPKYAACRTSAQGGGVATCAGAAGEGRPMAQQVTRKVSGLPDGVVGDLKAEPHVSLADSKFLGSLWARPWTLAPRMMVRLLQARRGSPSGP